MMTPSYYRVKGEGFFSDPVIILRGISLCSIQSAFYFGLKVTNPKDIQCADGEAMARLIVH
jgi:hypothetical protein